MGEAKQKVKPGQVTTRRMCLLEYEGKTGGRFHYKGEGVRGITLTPAQWMQLGRPEHLTAVIYPGDRQDLLELSDFPQ